MIRDLPGARVKASSPYIIPAYSSCLLPSKNDRAWISINYIAVCSYNSSRYLLVQAANPLLKLTATYHMQKKKKNVGVSLLMHHVLHTYLCKQHCLHHICLCNSENNMPLFIRIFRYGKFPIHEKRSHIYVHTYTFGGNVVELTDQCLMKATFLSVCPQTNVNRRAIWHTTLGDISKDLDLWGKTIGIKCLRKFWIIQHYSTCWCHLCKLLLGCCRMCSVIVECVNVS